MCKAVEQVSKFLVNNCHPAVKPTGETQSSGDPAGFPLSSLLFNRNVTLNITARTMACQAPQNWTAESSAAFLTRHFFRALLQRIFKDKGVVSPTEPIILGSLRKQCYISFYDYVTGAMRKIMNGTSVSEAVKSRINASGLLSIEREEVEQYERKYYGGKKNLSVTWSLMAFSAGCVESLIVVDRWLFLRESGLISIIKVESAFDHISMY